MFRTFRLCVLVLIAPLLTLQAPAEEPTRPTWIYSPDLLRPLWQGDTVEGESVLFIKNVESGEAKASVLFPVTDLLTVRNSAGTITYKEGRDYRWTPNSREILLPKNSRIVSHTLEELRRPAGSQKYRLTHRDGNGEIFFAAQLEYAAMQTCVTYRHGPIEWNTPVPKFDPTALPKSVAKLRHEQPLSIVVLGDSISTELNTSGLFNSPPYQPGYPGLIKRHLHEEYHSEITLTNLSVGGTDTKWGLTQIDKVIAAEPQLVILAFGMNDSTGRPPEEYQKFTQQMIEEIRKKLPETEFILVASMLGNRDWGLLKQENFPAYRDALAKLCEPGIALADVTSIWSGILERKHDWDQTGNGVNHPNDFGHRVYAQVILELLNFAE